MSPRLDESHTRTATSAPPPEQPRPLGGTDGPYRPGSADGFGGLEGLEGLPEIPPFDQVGPMDARALSKTLFERLESLEEGTHEYSYVRNTLVELNLALVKFAASRFRSRSEPMEDIIQVGTIGLI